MSAHRFVHVGFMFPGVTKMRDLEPIFAQLGDFVRYSQTSWILWTDIPAATIFLVLNRAIDLSDQIFIAALNVEDSFGRLSPWIWDWMKSKRPHLFETASSLSSLNNKLLYPPIDKK